MSRFFQQPTPLTVREIAALTGAVPRPDAALDTVVSGIDTLDRARPADLVFIDSPKYLDRLALTRGGACLTTEKLSERAPASLAVLLTRNPLRDFVAVARKLYPESLSPRSMFGGDGIAEGANVHPSAQLEDGVTVDPGAVIGPRAAIGAGTVIGANAVIGPDVQVGRDCSIGPGTSVMHALIGDGVIVHGGCCVGQDGFRYNPTARGHVKVPQLGRVIIQDNVEIGANTCIDRGGTGDTVIGEGAKIDNLVHIAHNCQIGRHCIIAGQCGMAGSVVVHDFAMMGGQVGVADHVTIGEGARIGAKSGVMSDIPAGEQWFGYPAMRGRSYLRAFAGTRKRD